MLKEAQSATIPKPGTGLGIYFVAGPVVVCIAGIGGKFGERLAGGPGYWVGCYLAALVAAASVGLLCARLFGAHPLYIAFGALGLLLGGHLTWALLGGKATEAPLSSSDQFLVSVAALTGTCGLRGSLSSRECAETAPNPSSGSISRRVLRSRRPPARRNARRT